MTTQVPDTLSTLVREQTEALMQLDEIDMPATERADVIASALRDFAAQVRSIPEGSLG